MFLLRRAAVRAVSAQPSRQLSTLRPVTRVTSFQNSKSLLYRSFHQSRICRAEEDKKVEEASPALAETTNETVTEEPSAQDEAIKEETLASSEVTDAAPERPTGQPDHAHDAVSESSGTTSSPLGQSEAEPQTISEQASSIAEKAKDTVSETVNAGIEAAEKNFSQSSQEVVKEVSSSAQEAVKEATSKAQDALTGVAAAATSAFPPTSRTRNDQREEIKPSRILYIGNLFFEVTAPQLEAEFGRFGEVTNSRVVTDNRGLSKGFGYVEFGNQEAADKAVRELDQKVFQGRRMAVQYHVRRERQGLGRQRAGQLGGTNTPSKTLFIGNMSYQMSDRDLNDLFRQIRNVLDVRVAIDRRSGQPRGFAHADFIDVESAEKAKAVLEKKVVYGRQLRVDYSGQNNSNKEAI